MADEITSDETDAVSSETGVAATQIRVTQAIAFHLGEQRYALPIERVQEIQQIVAFSEIPSGDDAVVGMVNLRGRVIPALDMRRLVGLDPVEYGLKTPMIICRLEEAAVALIVDEVEDVITLSQERISPPPKLHRLASRMLGVCHIGTELVFLLDVDRLLEPVELPDAEVDE